MTQTRPASYSEFATDIFIPFENSISALHSGVPRSSKDTPLVEFFHIAFAVPGTQYEFYISELLYCNYPKFVPTEDEYGYVWANNNYFAVDDPHPPRHFGRDQREFGSTAADYEKTRSKYTAFERFFIDNTHSVERCASPRPHSRYGIFGVTNGSHHSNLYRISILPEKFPLDIKHRVYVVSDYWEADELVELGIKAVGPVKYRFAKVHKVD